MGVVVIVIIIIIRCKKLLETPSGQEEHRRSEQEGSHLSGGETETGEGIWPPDTVGARSLGLHQRNRYPYHSHFTDEELEAQRGQVICSKATSSNMCNWTLSPGFGVSTLNATHTAF